MKKSRLTYILTAILLTSVLFSCNDDPTEIGTEFLQDTMSVDLLSDLGYNMLTNAHSEYISISERNTGSVLVGITDEFKSAALVRFIVPITKGNLKSEDIVSCNLYIFPEKYAIGDTNSNQFGFDVVEVTGHWTQSETTYKDIFESNKLFQNSRHIGEWSGQIVRKDTMDTVSIPFPKEICLEWFSKIGDGTNIKDTVWGIALMPKPNCNIINGIRSYSNVNLTYGSYIRIKYNRQDTVNADSIVIVLDSFDLTTGDECSFVQPLNQLNSKELIVQGGVRTHTKLTIDISNLPILSAINYAELTLFVDTSKTKSGTISNSASLGLSLFPDTATGEKIITEPRITIVGRYDSTQQAFVFKNYLHAPLNNLIRTTGGKGSMVIAYDSIPHEYNYMNKYVFYNMDAVDSTKRPRFKIVYSEIKK